MPENIRPAVSNNGGGHANHTLFWEIMGPEGGGEPTGDARPRRSTRTFGGFDKLKEQVNEAGVDALRQRLGVARRRRRQAGGRC